MSVGLGDVVMAIQILYGSYKFVQDYRHGSANQQRQLKRVRRYSEFLNDLDIEFKQAQDDAGRQRILEEIDVAKSACRKFQEWLEEAASCLVDASSHRSLLRSPKTLFQKAYFVSKARGKLRNFDETVDWPLLEACISQCERRKQERITATILQNIERVTTAVEESHAETRSVQWKVEKAGNILENTHADAQKTRGLVESMYDKQASRDQDAEAALTLLQQTKGNSEEIKAINLETLQHMKAMMIAPVLPPRPYIAPQLQRLLQLDLRYALLLLLSLKPFHMTLGRVPRFRRIRTKHPKLGSFEIPTDGFTHWPNIHHALLQLQENSSGPSRADRQFMTQTAHLHENSAQPDVLDDMLTIEPLGIQLAGLDISTSNLLESGAGEEQSNIRQNQPRPRLHSSGTTFTQRNWGIHRHFDVAEARLQGLDLELSAMKSYTPRGLTYNESLRQNWEIFGDTDFLDGMNESLTQSSILRSSISCNAAKSGKLSVVHLIKDDPALEPSFNADVRACAMLAKNPPKLKSNAERPLSHCALAVLSGSPNMLLHMFIYGYESLHLFKDTQAAMAVIHERYNRDCLEYILFFALKDAPSKPKEYQQTVDQVLYEATCQNLEELARVLLFVGANPFAIMDYEDNSSAFEYAVVGRMTTWVKDFLLVAWDRRLLKTEDCKRYINANDLNWVALQKERREISTFIARRLSFETQFWLTNLHTRRFPAEDNFWWDYVVQHKLLSTDILGVDVDVISAFIKQNCQRESKLPCLQTAVQFTWARDRCSGWCVEELTDLGSILSSDKLVDISIGTTPVIEEATSSPEPGGAQSAMWDSAGVGAAFRRLKAVPRLKFQVLS